MTTRADMRRDANIQRIADSLDSIAKSLEKLANPVVGVGLAHDVTVSPHNGSHRAKCSCGWTSLPYKLATDASRDGANHVSIMNSWRGQQA